MPGVQTNNPLKSTSNGNKKASGKDTDKAEVSVDFLEEYDPSLVKLNKVQH